VRGEAKNPEVPASQVQHIAFQPTERRFDTHSAVVRREPLTAPVRERHSDLRLVLVGERHRLAAGAGVIRMAAVALHSRMLVTKPHRSRRQGTADPCRPHRRPPEALGSIRPLRAERHKCVRGSKRTQLLCTNLVLRVQVPGEALNATQPLWQAFGVERAVDPDGSLDRSGMHAVLLAV